jgi:hypothetical protein
MTIKSDAHLEPETMIPKNVAEILRNHVVLEVESIDRMYLNGYVPLLQSDGGAASFIRNHLGKPFASTAAVAPMSHQFVIDIERFAQQNGVEIVCFAKGQRKDDVMKEYFAKFQPPEGVLFIGKAQEKAFVFRTVKRKNPQTGQSYPWLVRGTALPNHYYFYIVDDDFGPMFIKFCSYFPYAVKFCINGHEWVKRQLTKEAIGFVALDNGILSCDNPQRLQQLCLQLDEQKIDTVFRKWLARLPHPFCSEHRSAGYRYNLSNIQLELSLTQVFDRPMAGRQFFEEVVRENIDLGRPEMVQLIFGRRITRRTPSSFRTRIVTQGVVPTLNVYYKKSKIKQYYKEGRGLRTETTINDTRDFGIGRMLKNLDALRQIGFSANRRLLDVQTISHDCTMGDEKFMSLIRPSSKHGQRISALPFGNVRVQALMQTLCLFALVPNGFRSREAREYTSQLLGAFSPEYTSGKMTYDLRRLRLHGLIKRIPRSNRYQLTDDGVRASLFFTRAQTRFFRTAFSSPMCTEAKSSSVSIHAFRKAYKAVDGFIEKLQLAS